MDSNVQQGTACIDMAPKDQQRPFTGVSNRGLITCINLANAAVPQFPNLMTGGSIKQAPAETSSGTVSGEVDRVPATDRSDPSPQTGGVYAFKLKWLVFHFDEPNLFIWPI
jgi:hypothetical protein